MPPYVLVSSFDISTLTSRSGKSCIGKVLILNDSTRIVRAMIDVNMTHLRVPAFAAALVRHGSNPHGFVQFVAIFPRTPNFIFFLLSVLLPGSRWLAHQGPRDQHDPSLRAIVVEASRFHARVHHSDCGCQEGQESKPGVLHVAGV